MSPRATLPLAAGRPGPGRGRRPQLRHPRRRQGAGRARCSRHRLVLSRRRRAAGRHAGTAWSTRSSPRCPSPRRGRPVLTRHGWALLIVGRGALVAARALRRASSCTSLGAVLVVAARRGCRALRAGGAGVRLRVRADAPPARRARRRHRPGRAGASPTAAHRRTPVLTLRDPVGGTAAPLLHLAPLKPGERRRAAYRLPTEPAGRPGRRPARGSTSRDPFGLARRRPTLHRGSAGHRLSRVSTGCAAPGAVATAIPAAPWRNPTRSAGRATSFYVAAGVRRRATTCAACTGRRRPAATS